MLATFTTAAKEELLSSFVPWSADECICAFESQGKKVHQGVAPQNLALHQGIAWSNSTTALGLRGAQLETRVRSRCTSKERDAESNLDMFGARYYGSSLGRFMTPDWSSKPEPVPYADFENPQSLNQYSYSGNNPSSKSDPDGHCDVDGEHHWGWCIWHTLGLYETQVDRVNDARNFFNNNDVTIGGNHVDPSKMTDQQVLAAFKQYNDAYRAAGGDVSPNGALAALLPGAGLRYEPNPKHGTSARGDVSAEPTNPQQTLENSVPIKNTSTARVGVDPSTGEYVMFRETSSGVYHGYATTNFNDLPNEAKAALQNAGMVSQSGKMQ